MSDNDYVKLISVEGLKSITAAAKFVQLQTMKIPESLSETICASSGDTQFDIVPLILLRNVLVPMPSCVSTWIVCVESGLGG